MYDAFVWRHGPLSSRENIRAFAGDPDQPLLLSLENYDAESKARDARPRYSSGARWSATSPQTHVETAAEALAISLNETGENRLAAHDGASPAARDKQLQRELRGLVYRNPEGANGKPPTAT